MCQPRWCLSVVWVHVLGSSTPRGMIGARMERFPAKLRPPARRVKKAADEDYLSVMTGPDPSAMRAAAREVAALIHPGTRVCLTTHVNPDGDGLGSEVAMVH